MQPDQTISGGLLKARPFFTTEYPELGNPVLNTNADPALMTDRATNKGLTIYCYERTFVAHFLLWLLMVLDKAYA